MRWSDERRELRREAEELRREVEKLKAMRKGLQAAIDGAGVRPQVIAWAAEQAAIAMSLVGDERERFVQSSVPEKGPGVK